MKLIRPTRHMGRHFLEMVIAMMAGMVILGPVWPHPAGQVELQSLIMATNMAIGMTAWMIYRKQPWRSIAAMDAAMYVPFILLFAPYWAGFITAGTVMSGGHLLMLPAMALVMLRQPNAHDTVQQPSTEHPVTDGQDAHWSAQTTGLRANSEWR